jgi:hypothetical protein
LRSNKPPPSKVEREITVLLRRALPPVTAERTMPLNFTYQPIRVLIDGHDSEGRLIFADGQLSAVIVRLDGPAHNPEHKGRWNLEAGFGKCDVRDAPLFKTPEEAGAWVEQTLTRTAFRVIMEDLDNVVGSNSKK